ncbi:MAG TPA: GAF and ANTAR domain-containing protein [Jatrophihabitantaceae bacterium]|jgi:GAF domain-containing protein
MASTAISQSQTSGLATHVPGLGEAESFADNAMPSHDSMDDDLDELEEVGEFGEPRELTAASIASLVQLLRLVRADLAAVFQNEEATPEQLLDQIVQVATRLVPGAEDAGVAVFCDGQLRTVAAVGELTLALDALRRAVGEGPSLDVARTGQTLRVPDLATDSRWTVFGARAAQEGVRSVLACALPLPRRQAGVLSLFSSRPAAFDAAAELVVPVFAARAAIALAHAEKVGQLERALQSRQVIGQAVGILMERHRLSETQAFDTLVKASQESHLKLREVARRVTESGEDPDQAARPDH